MKQGFSLMAKLPRQYKILIIIVFIVVISNILFRKSKKSTQVQHFNLSEFNQLKSIQSNLSDFRVRLDGIMEK